MKKIYHVVASRAGCFGASSSCERMPERYTSRREADKARAAHTRAAEDNRTVYFVEWEWQA